MRAARTRHGIATIGGVLAVATAALAMVPVASSAAGPRACGNRTISYKVPTEATGPTPSVKLPVLKITVQGASCATAFKVIEAFYTSNTATLGGFKCTIGKFKVPPGKVAEQCTRGAVKIQFAGEGG